MNTPVTIMPVRMKPLSRRHRIAHLCALLGARPASSSRRQELMALLCAEMAARLPCEGRAT